MEVTKFFGKRKLMKGKEKAVMTCGECGHKEIFG